MLRRWPFLALCGALSLSACGDDDGGDEQLPADGGAIVTPDAGKPTANLDAGTLDAAAPSRTDAGRGDAGTVRCIDEQFAKLMLFDAPSPSLVTEEGATAGVHQTLIDTMGGGMTVSQSYVYARFTPNGLEKVAIGDEAAFASSDWHIALRRYVIRLNSGVSGPGSVRGARLGADAGFDTLTTVPSGLTYRSEAYYDESCKLVADDSGIESPDTVLATFWTYLGCVKMTNEPFVIELPDGRHVKLQVASYYAPEVQKSCQETDKITSPSGAGNLRLRWSFLD